MKILCTGNNTSGLSQIIHEQLGAKCVGRSNGYDLSTQFGDAKQECVHDLTYESLNYNVFINCARLTNFSQTILLYKLWHCWNENNHNGHIINIGSDIVYKVGHTILSNPDFIYDIEKQSLLNLHRKLCFKNPNILMSIINTGRLGKEHIKYNTIVDMLKIILQSKNSYFISEIALSEIKK